MGRVPKGTSIRKHFLWTPDTWSDGYYDNRGRFRVYRPDYPRAYKNGYALRAHVVYWLETGEVHPCGTVLHHKNDDRTDDRFENLDMMTHGEHTTYHKIKPLIQLKCKNCNQSFGRHRWYINQYIRRYGHKPQTCCRTCDISYRWLYYGGLSTKHPAMIRRSDASR